MTRIPDVGNPWLDAGIVPFSTMQYNTNPQEWEKWYPADLVSECFPGQFRNWFYALLSMATMMDGTPPFKTLLGYRLVLNEEGKPMHKSDGTAIWFEEAAEQLGVDTMRWMYLAHNPASDLRFGMRHPGQEVTLVTPEGAINQTKEGSPTCLVESKPADEIRRQVLIPLWNSYAFFVNYARLDEFDPSQKSVPVKERPEIDRWILSNLQALLATAKTEIAAYNYAGFLKKATAFIDDLSNWYIRRNRRRFWRSQDANDTDKLAAYQTLFEVLVTLSKALAPTIPFLTERIYQNLVTSWDQTAPSSVHLCDYPECDATLLDEELNFHASQAQIVVKLGHKLRDESNQRVRQPLAELRFTCRSPEQMIAVESLANTIEEELNIKKVTRCENLDDLVSYTYKPNLKTLGPKYGKLLGMLRQQLPEVGDAVLGPLRRGESVSLELSGNQIDLQPEDVLVGTEQAAEWICADDQGIQIAISTKLTPELEEEGMARDFVRQVQQLRKEADLEIEDRINIDFNSNGTKEVEKAITDWSDYILGETLGDQLNQSDKNDETKEVTIGNFKVLIRIEKS